MQTRKQPAEINNGHLLPSKKLGSFSVKIKGIFLVAAISCVLCSFSETEQSELPDRFSSFCNRRTAYFSRVFSDELNRLPPGNKDLESFIEHYLSDVEGSGRINFSSGFFPVVSQELLLSLYQEAELLRKNGANHPLLYFCQLSILRKIDTKTFGQNPTATRKRTAEAGLAVSQNAHPMIRYEFLRELYWRSQNPGKEKRIQEIAGLLPELFKKSEIRSTEEGVLLEHLSREVLQGSFSIPHRRLLADSLAAAPDVDDLFKLFADGCVHIDEAWQSRGNGWSYTVTMSGNRGFKSNLAEARKSLEQAWELDPSLPEIPAAMITVSMGESASPEEKKCWFDRSISARCDYYPAYHNYLYASTPRWSGSLMGFLNVILKSSLNSRFDTIIPWQNITALGWINNELRFPDHLPESFSKLLSHVQAGYAAEPSLCREDREALMTVLAAFFVRTQSPEKAHHILSDQDYRVSTLYAAHNYGMDTYDFVWQAWYSAPEIKHFRTAWIESEQSDRMDNINELYSLFLKKAGNSMELRQRVHLDRALVDYKSRIESGEWVDIYSPEAKPNWVNQGLYWTPDSSGGFKASEERTLGWIPAEVRLYEGFELELELQSINPSKKQRACIFFGRPEWNVCYMPQVQLKYGDNKIEYISGRNEQMDMTSNQVPVQFSGKDCVLIKVEDKQTTILLNGKEVFSGRVHPGKRYAETLWIGLGDGYEGFYNDKNIYHRIRVRKLSDT
ncbi:MAG: hypothetical protein AB7E95_10570 [Kiritimatiellales bacterium]